MSVADQTLQENLLKRLRRIEGQVRGVARMITEERDCREILQQLAAIRSAVQQVNWLILRSYANQCLRGANSEKTSSAPKQAALDELWEVLSKLV